MFVSNVTINCKPSCLHCRMKDWHGIQWCAAVSPAIWEAEVGGLNLRPAWATYHGPGGVGDTKIRGC